MIGVAASARFPLASETPRKELQNHNMGVLTGALLAYAPMSL